ncbi:hypothetical protein L596_021067 [Steinernema carpocapsae]|uniref:Uncharacterized protein n=1 Tax=Steinernema carpocapsae TaxID=34508 RepID=A0A4U5MVD9_STECR|nr:hypothetical protein L596_021067 [Steinernema carpocapsae]
MNVMERVAMDFSIGYTGKRRIRSQNRLYCCIQVFITVPDDGHHRCCVPFVHCLAPTRLQNRPVRGDGETRANANGTASVTRSLNQATRV